MGFLTLKVSVRPNLMSLQPRSTGADIIIVLAGSKPNAGTAAPLASQQPGAVSCAATIATCLVHEGLDGYYSSACGHEEFYALAELC